MTDKRYKILDTHNYQYVTMIAATGHVVNSTIGTLYDNYGDAMSYIYNSQTNAIRAGTYIDISRFVVVEVYFVTGTTHSVHNVLQQTLLKCWNEPEKQQWFGTLIEHAVKNGFNTVDAELYNFALTNDKYAPILSERVPPHMLQCIDEFQAVGILGCDIDVLGSISLTATENQITMYDIDGLIQSRT